LFFPNAPYILQVNKEGLIRGFAYEINKDPKWVHVEWILE